MEDFIIITPEIYKSYLPIEIAAFHYSDMGACGHPGMFHIITSDKRMYKMYYFYDRWIKEELDIISPILTNMRNLPEGWSSRYMGLGNWLFVNEEILSKLPIEGIDPRELYQKWTSFVLNAL